MRTALISALKTTARGQLRALQTLAGRSVLAWQIDLALTLGCERIVCLGEVGDDEIIAQQRRVEKGGLTFHTVRGHLQFASLIRSEDDVLIQLDGLVLGHLATGYLENLETSQSPFLVAFPTSHPLSVTFSTDFERIDRDRHWAGIAMIPGQCTEQLKMMPEDGDAMSLLLRLALQERVPCKVLPGALSEDGQWLLASDEEALDARGKAILEQSLAKADWSAPATALATSMVRTTSHHWLGQASDGSGILALVIMASALGLAGFGFGFAGLGVGALAALFVCLCNSSAVLRSAISPSLGSMIFARYLNLTVNFVAMLLLIFAHDEAANWPIQAALPVLAIGFAQIAARDAPERFQAIWRDLPSQLLLFAIADYLGLLQEALLVFLAGALLQLLLRKK